MREAQFEEVISDAGLNLLLGYRGRFVVSLRIGGRFQCCTLVFTGDEGAAYVVGKKKEMEDASKTKQGRMAEERTPRAKQKIQKTVSQTTINYPAH